MTSKKQQLQKLGIKEVLQSRPLLSNFLLKRVPVRNKAKAA
jgi:hypothetical protein